MASSMLSTGAQKLSMACNFFQMVCDDFFQCLFLTPSTGCLTALFFSTVKGFYQFFMISNTFQHFQHFTMLLYNTYCLKKVSPYFMSVAQKSHLTNKPEANGGLILPPSLSLSVLLFTGI